MAHGHVVLFDEVMLVRTRDPALRAVHSRRRVGCHSKTSKRSSFSDGGISSRVSKAVVSGLTNIANAFGPQERQYVTRVQGVQRPSLEPHDILDGESHNLLS
jgi:hypothetical protein